MARGGTEIHRQPPDRAAERSPRPLFHGRPDTLGLASKVPQGFFLQRQDCQRVHPGRRKDDRRPEDASTSHSTDDRGHPQEPLKEARQRNPGGGRSG